MYVEVFQRFLGDIEMEHLGIKIQWKVDSVSF